MSNLTIYATVAHASETAHVLVLDDAIQKIATGCELHVLLIGSKNPLTSRPNIKWHNQKEVGSFQDRLKWTIKYGWRSNQRILSGALKPFFVRHLIQTYTANVILIDPTCLLYSEPVEIKSALHQHGVILIPNGFSMDPNETDSTFLWYFSRGYYTAGLVGFRHNALDELNWWAKVCSYACEVNQMKAFYYEQAYLNFLPIMYERPKVLLQDHIYCGIGRAKSLTSSGPIDFRVIHFDEEVVELIRDNPNHPLYNHWMMYQNQVKVNKQ